MLRRGRVECALITVNNISYFIKKTTMIISILTVLLVWKAITLRIPLVSSMTLEVQVNYPQSQVQEIPGGAVFALQICYLPGCPSDAWWNQSQPGLPYIPELTILNSDYQGDDLYLKSIDIPNFEGTVYLTVYAAYSPAGDIFGLCSIKDYCNSTTVDPASNDCVAVGMPYRSVTQSLDKALIVAYPYFGAVAGSVYTMFPNLYSPQLHNFRDINVYIPASWTQNSINRSVNVLIVNDGTLFFLQQLAFLGGFDRAALTGAVPETIMIGVPQNVSGCERQYELTFSVEIAPTSCPSGGNSVYFQFLQETVVPAVVGNLTGMTLGEVSMTGVSFGGLTSCYAASYLPSYFRRVYCQSPSVWWNYGQLPTQTIPTNAATNGLPFSVAIYIGTTEMSVPQCVNINCTSTTPWITFVNETAYAWLNAGLPSDRLFFFTVNGGQHDSTAWATSFTTGIVQLYAPNFTSPYQDQYLASSASSGNINILVGGETCDHDDVDTVTSNKSRFTDLELVLLIFVVLEASVILVIVLYYWYFRAIGGGLLATNFNMEGDEKYKNENNHSSIYGKDVSNKDGGRDLSIQKGADAITTNPIMVEMEEAATRR